MQAPPLSPPALPPRPAPPRPAAPALHAQVPDGHAAQRVSHFNGGHHGVGACAGEGRVHCWRGGAAGTQHSSSGHSRVGQQQQQRAGRNSGRKRARSCLSTPPPAVGCCCCCCWLGCCGQAPAGLVCARQEKWEKARQFVSAARQAQAHTSSTTTHCHHQGSNCTATQELRLAPGRVARLFPRPFASYPCPHRPHRCAHLPVVHSCRTQARTCSTRPRTLRAEKAQDARVHTCNTHAATHCPRRTRCCAPSL